MSSQSRITLSRIHPVACATMNAFHSEVIKEIEKEISTNQVVVIGMAWNPFVQKMKSKFENEKVPYKYLEYGNYLYGWKKRLAIKLWSGWPTFPQVFLNGILLGGYSDVVELIQKNEIKFDK